MREFDQRMFTDAPFYNFTLGSLEIHESAAIIQQMVDEMMYRLSAMLPEYYRGEYSDLENATEKYIL